MANYFEMTRDELTAERQLWKKSTRNFRQWA